jgi:hypothetical protein
LRISRHGTAFDVDELDDDDDEEEEDPLVKLLKFGCMTSSPFRRMSLALIIVNLARDLFNTKYL